MAKITFITFEIDYSIGVYVLSSILEDAGHDVSLIFFKLECSKPIKWFKEKPINFELINVSGDIIGRNSDVNRETQTEVKLLTDQLIQLNPDVLCISARTVHNNIVQDIIPEIRTVYDGPILAGGFGPTLEPDKYLEWVDYVYLGDAESDIGQVINSIVDGKDIKQSNNICFKENGRIYRNKLHLPDIKNFKSQKIPEKVFYIENDHIYDFSSRGEIIDTHKYSTFVGRGCISNCSYCSANRWYQLYRDEGIKVRRRRNRPVEEVIEELKNIKNDYTFILFRDEFLCGNIEYLKTFFRLYEREINIPFWAYLVPDQMLAHPELLKMAVDAGFVDTELGFQSGSNWVNRKIFTRYLSNSTTVEYAKLLSDYQINVKYDFIVFNPAESYEDIKKTFALIQELPKNRAYIQLARLHYFPGTPITQILSKYQHIQHDFSYYYSIALLYLLCFVLPKSTFASLLNDSEMTSSWEKLLHYYKRYIRDNNINFPIGTHAIPESITTPRYERIIKKNEYSDIIIYGDTDYYNKMKSIFNDVNILHYIKNNGENYSNKNNLSKILMNISEPIPIFICSENKETIKTNLIKNYPNYPGKVYV